MVCTVSSLYCYCLFGAFMHLKIHTANLQPRSVLEIMSNGFYSGELGPSTIATWCLQVSWGGVPAADLDPDTVGRRMSPRLGQLRLTC